MYYKLVFFAAVCTVSFQLSGLVQSASCYVYNNEISQPFVVAMGFSIGFVVRSIVAKTIPLIYENYPLHWTPFCMFFSGTITFLLFRPMLIETKNRSIQAIENDYAK